MTRLWISLCCLIVTALPARAVAQSTSTTLLPFAAYAPETSMSFGVLVARVTDTEEGAFLSRFSGAAFYTLKNQSMLVGGYEARPEGWHVVASGSFKFEWPDQFFAPGNDLGPDDFEDWTGRSVEGRASILRQVGVSSLFVGPVAEILYTQIRDLEEGGLLDTGSIPGSEDHGLLGLGLGATWDTRDSPIFPRTGSFHQLNVLAMRGFSGPDRTLSSWELDARTYLPLGGSSALAFRGRLRSADGDVPFTRFSRIGGMSGGLRGIYETRYIGQAAGMAVAEIRAPLKGRFGWVAFAGAGQVGRNLGRLSIPRFNGAVGAGLRFVLQTESRLNLGVDFAVADGETNVYFLLGEVF